MNPSSVLPTVAFAVAISCFLAPPVLSLTGVMQPPPASATKSRLEAPADAPLAPRLSKRLAKAADLCGPMDVTPAATDLRRVMAALP